MPQFHETGYGRTFFGSQLPSLIKSLGKLSNVAEVAMQEADLQDKISAYDKYIQEANDDDKYRSGWRPVCFHEFCECDYPLIKEQELFDETLKWFDEQIAIAQSVGTMGAATLLTLTDGRKKHLARKGGQDV